METECQVKVMACTKALGWGGDENVLSNERKGNTDSKKGQQVKLDQ